MGKTPHSNAKRILLCKSIIEELKTQNDYNQTLDQILSLLHTDKFYLQQ